MTREEVKRRAELYSALAEGKTIQFKNMDGEWTDVKPEKLNYIPEELVFRIKHEPKYRPFKTAEECWNEARKHNDFPWIRYIGGGFTQIKSIGTNDIIVENILEQPHTTYSFAMAYLTLTFVDDTPFGIKEE